MDLTTTEWYQRQKCVQRYKNPTIQLRREVLHHMDSAVL